MLACVVIFLGITAGGGDEPSNALLARWGHVTPTEIWDGAYWSLITSAFVHIDLLHLIMNMGFLWVMGPRMESAIGPVRFLGFIVLSAFVASAWQLAVSDTTGIGFSGVGFAMFGFMWIARDWYPEFQDIMNQRTLRFVAVWYVGCIVATQLGILAIANTAHTAGAIFGGLAAGMFVLRRKGLLSFAGMALLVVGSVVPLFWSPWSALWLSHQAYTAQVESRHADAIELYDRLIEREPKNAWAYHNRGVAYWMQKQFGQAKKDFAKAHQLKPAAYKSR